MCPGQNESAGKRRSSKARKGNRYLRATLIQAGLAATRKKNSALRARYHRVKRHGGHKKAVVAVGHQMLEIAYYVMRDGGSYVHEYPSQWAAMRSIAEKLGCTVEALRRWVRQAERDAGKRLWHQVLAWS